jgi:hypothetical protein
MDPNSYFGSYQVRGGRLAGLSPLAFTLDDAGHLMGAVP